MSYRIKNNITQILKYLGQVINKKEESLII